MSQNFKWILDTQIVQFHNGTRNFVFYTIIYYTRIQILVLSQRLKSQSSNNSIIWKIISKIINCLRLMVV